MAGPKDTEDVPERRPVTRSLVQSGLVSSSVPSGATSPAKKTKAKKVKFVEPNNSAAHNSSVATDEGIDLSFSSPRASASIKIPASIVRPHHGLGQAWTFWFSGSNRRDSWSQDLVTVANMKTVEDFWTIYNQIQPCSLLKAGQSYSVFKTGVAPDWEDPANKAGGRWMISFNTEERKDLLDQRWLEVLICVLGDRMGHIVTGVEVAVRRKMDRVEVWLGTTTDLQLVTEVGRKLKAQLGTGKTKMKFSIHREEKEGVKRPCLMI